MKTAHAFRHEFVEFIPDKPQQGVLYVSIPYATVVHLCACGCGKEVVTPLSPTDWKLIFDGQSISLNPSIGNWSFECQSHYFINGNRIQWAAQLSREQIAAGRRVDRAMKDAYHATTSLERPLPQASPGEVAKVSGKKGFWKQLWESVFGK